MNEDKSNALVKGVSARRRSRNCATAVYICVAAPELELNNVQYMHEQIVGAAKGDDRRAADASIQIGEAVQRSVEIGKCAEKCGMSWRRCNGTLQCLLSLRCGF